MHATTLQDLRWERKLSQMATHCMIPFRCPYRKSKTVKTDVGLDLWLLGSGSGRRKFTKGYKRNILEWWNVLVLVCGATDTTVWVCQNSWNCTPKKVSFTICILYINNLDQK